ncbi:MAG: CARDB domain-containing protein, partial [Thermoplasmata archaeon]
MENLSNTKYKKVPYLLLSGVLSILVLLPSLLYPTFSFLDSPHFDKKYPDRTTFENYGISELDENSNLLKFNPRTLSGRFTEISLPDLVVKDIVFSKDVMVEGERVSIFATVENIGTANTTSGVDYVMYADGSQIGAGILSPLEAGQSRLLRVDWTVTPGIHEFTVEADYTNSILEENETNNIFLSRKVVGLPDITITGIDYFPKDYNEGDKVTVAAIIKNKGCATAKNFRVSIKMDETLLGIKLVEGLPENGEAVVTSEWTASGGFHTIEVNADSQNELREANESNNFMFIPIHRGDVDIAVEFLNELIPSTSVQGFPLNLTLRVTNRGNLDINKRVGIYVYECGEFLKYIEIDNLSAGNSTELSFEYRLLGGKNIITAVLDANTLPSDYNTTNDKSTIFLEGEPCNIRVVSNRLSVPEPVDGQPVSLLVQVRNEGPGEIQFPITVTAYVDEECAGSASVESLGVGEVEEVSFPWVACAGRHEFRAEAGNPLIIETDLNDNVNFTYMDIKDFNLVLSAISFTDEQPSPGEAIVASVNITNEGPGDTLTPVVVYLYLDSGDVVSGMYTGRLNAGETATVAIPFIVP